MKSQAFGTSVPVLVVSLASASIACAQASTTWIGPSGGLWSSPLNWTNGVPGTPGITDAIIATRRPSMVVTMDGWPSIALLSIGASCTLNQTDDHDLIITALVNNGLWSLVSSGSGTDILLNANVHFDGNGVIELGTHQNNRILSIASTRVLTNEAQHTIRGGGQLGLNNTTIVNHGLIESQGSPGMWLDGWDGATSVNDGVLRAGADSTLTVYGTEINNVGGAVRAEPGGRVLLRSSAITGGICGTVGSGEIRLTSEISRIADVTNQGVIRQPDDGDCVVAGTVNNLGVWSLESSGSGTDLVLNSPTVSFIGTGAIEMGNHTNNRVYSNAAVRTLVNGAQHAIRGAGQLGFNNTVIVNHGLIESTLPVGLLIDVNDGMSFTNQSLVRSRNGSTLTFYGSGIDNSVGEIRAEDGSAVVFRYASVLGGMLATQGSGQFRLTNEVSQLQDVTKEGLLRQVDDADVLLQGTIVNHGTWAMESAGSATDILLNSPTVTFTGPGAIEASNNVNNRLYSSGPVRTLVNGATHVIRGAGQFGFNSAAITNDGIIEATLPAGLTLDTVDSFPLVNHSLLRSRDGSTLTLYGSNLDNTNGVIRAEDASIVAIRYGSLTGGIIESIGSGFVRLTNEPTVLSDVVQHGALAMPDDADCFLTGTFTNEGTWSMNSAGSGTDVWLASDVVTLNGDGVLQLSDHINNRIYSTGAVRTLVNAHGHTIRGGGQIGVNNTSMANHGTIDATGNSPIVLDAYDSGSFVNAGLMRASGPGGLSIGVGPWLNQGTVIVEHGSKLHREGAYTQVDGETRIHGALEVPWASYAQSKGLLSGDGTVSGAVSITGGSCSPSAVDNEIGTLTVQGSYAQGSAGGLVIDLGLSGNDVLVVNGPATLGGALQVRLVGSFVPMPGQQFTILSASSVAGYFGCVEFPNAPIGYFSVAYHPTSVTLTVTSTPTQESDLDFDGAVGASDLAILLGAWGDDPCDNAICCPADLNGDGKVNASDLAILLGDWG
ncbi:MAG: hypothetical protein U0572_00155 [Phycisphaerales bacterium]